MSSQEIISIKADPDRKKIINKENIDSFDKIINDGPKEFTKYIIEKRKVIKEKQEQKKISITIGTISKLQSLKDFIGSNENSNGSNIDEAKNDDLSYEDIKENLYKVYEEFKSQKISKKDMKVFQRLVGTSPDGTFGPKTFLALLKFIDYSDKEKFKSGNIGEDLTIKSIVSEHMGISELDGKKESFREIYGDFTKILGNQLGLPDNFIEAVIRKETNYGANLQHSKGSRGMMQLTRVPFMDMQGYFTNDEGKTKKWVNKDREDTYSDIFEELDIEKLKNIPGIKEQLPNNLWEDLDWITTPSRDFNKYNDIIERFKGILKDKNGPYYHVLNMILGSVYLKYLYNNKEGNEDERIYKTAYAYNGNKKIINGKEIRDNYSKKVSKYVGEIGEEKQEK